MRGLGTSFFLLLAFLALPNDGYRILCFFPFHGKSHFIMFRAICQGLAKRGHQVDMVSHFPREKPMDNYRDIVDLRNTTPPIVGRFTLAEVKALREEFMYNLAVNYGNEICKILGHEKMQRFIKNLPNDPPYDVAITENFASGCFLGIGYLLKVPVVAAVSAMETPYQDEFLGNPCSTSFFPSYFMDEPVLRTFWDRLANAVHNLVKPQLFYYYTSPQTEITRRYLGEDLPSVRELEKSIGLTLGNTHYAFHGVRPLTNGFVEVGGIHVGEDDSELSPELKKWLDSATDGVVYFTLGSLMNVGTLPKATIQALYASFRKIAPVKVLMKIVDERQLPAGIPDNVHVLPWMPQIPILRHKNVRVFISHGGLMSTLEALHHAVPIIGLPLFADQQRNVNIFVHKNMGLRVDIEDIKEETMDAALRELLYDPKYKKAVERESIRFKDRPMSPMDTAVFWIEYVIRNGPDSLRSPAIDMPWWQLHLIDVYAFLTACVVALASIPLILLKMMLEGIRGKEKGRSARNKKRN
ncbi:hypothetical protein KM043_008894 [Ampulex compressa]|nr:hypothetical protein KM043_008894 [Ampulex compressa]